MITFLALTTFGNQISLQQRGKLKEEEFLKKLQDIMGEEERLRIPIAQGLPFTTDEPEVCASFDIYQIYCAL